MPILYGCSSDLGEDDAPLSFAGADAGAASNPTGSGKAGLMTAGEWNDSRNWGFWLDLLKRSEWAGFQTTWQQFPTERYTISLTDAAGQPLAGARVTLGDTPALVGVTAAVSDRLGRAELFPVLFQSGVTYTEALDVRVSYQGQQFTLAPVPAKDHQATRTVPVTAAVATPIDIMFVVDATGSMGDEINYLKTELRDVLSRAAAQLPASDLRMASVFYRDKTDDYLTRLQPFTQDVSQLLGFVQAQNAAGGGDTPEAVDEALHVALQQKWSAEARCRLLFLVLDAPPHLENIARIQSVTREAAKQGIRLIPVTASGIDKTTEFLMRSLALSTGGTYVFITNHSGIGNEHLEATVGKYEVEFLNDLMVRLITEYSK